MKMLPKPEQRKKAEHVNIKQTRSAPKSLVCTIDLDSGHPPVFLWLAINK